MTRRTELLALLVTACGPAPIVSDSARAPASDSCTEARDRSVSEAVSASASIDAGPIRWGAGSAAASRLVEVKLGYDALQKDFGQMAERLCRERERGRVSQAWYERRRECLDNAQILLRGVSLLAGGTAPDPDPRSVVMALEAKLDLVRETLRCPDRAEAPAPELTPVGGGQVRVNAWLVCERRDAESRFTTVTDCNATPLTAGDRVRIGYQVDAPAYVYITSRNDRGQFQALLPSPGADARAAPGVPLYFPEGGAWMELDDVRGVTELVQVMASVRPVASLDALRGQALQATDASVRAAALAVEPVLVRGWKLPAQAGGGVPGPSGAVAVSAGSAAVELRVIHQ